MREMLSAAKRPKKNALFELCTEKKRVFGVRKKSGIRVFIEAWYLSTRLAGGWFEKNGDTEHKQRYRSPKLVGKLVGDSENHNGEIQNAKD